MRTGLAISGDQWRFPFFDPPLTEAEQDTPEGERREAEWDPPKPLARLISEVAALRGKLQILYTDEGGDKMQPFDFRSEAQAQRGDPVVQPELLITDNAKFAARYAGICPVQTLHEAAKMYEIEVEEVVTAGEVEEIMADVDKKVIDNISRKKEQLEQGGREVLTSEETDDVRRFLEAEKKIAPAPIQHVVRGGERSDVADLIRQLRSTIGLAKFLLNQLEQKL